MEASLIRQRGRSKRKHHVEIAQVSAAALTARQAKVISRWKVKLHFVLLYAPLNNSWVPSKEQNLVLLVIKFRTKHMFFKDDIVFQRLIHITSAERSEDKSTLANGTLHIQNSKKAICKSIPDLLELLT